MKGIRLADDGHIIHVKELQRPSESEKTDKTSKEVPLDMLRAVAADLEHLIKKHCLDPRKQSIALTRLEEAMLWTRGGMEE